MHHLYSKRRHCYECQDRKVGCHNVDVCEHYKQPTSSYEIANKTSDLEVEQYNREKKKKVIQR